MMPKVVAAKPLRDEVKTYLKEHVQLLEWEEGNKEDYYAKLAEADGLLTTGGEPITPELLDRAPALKVVSNISVGYNNFDIAAMKARNIIGTNTPGVLDDTVADLIFALMLSAARRVPELDRYVRDGRWHAGDGLNLFGLDVHHRKLGIIGMGRIGEAVARRGKLGFGMDVIYHNRSRSGLAEEQLGAVYKPLNELLQEADFIVLMTPLTPETRGMLGAAEFALMKQTAVFVNASRGQTIDEQALVDALEQRKLYAAGLDVFELEPLPAGHPLTKLDNVVLLPHIGSATEATRLDMAMLAAGNLIDALYGKEPRNIVNELKRG
ncbi:2-hydroxyacid dehydrogenase [Paenibacillus protaetiae]|uniref:D-glycerate dehydrogenase n=1 Tax=Paenibacillus protaetiae TaxID=2509456 RepID=A0A4P6EVN8_9BACL|nr:D-glycerate dehydrogenase [Paenibacillus protaetiae]QAY65749.1 D-glycerate dehydrogenase [Paenibacillus protaetiae]